MHYASSPTTVAANHGKNPCVGRPPPRNARRNGIKGIAAATSQFLGPWRTTHAACCGGRRGALFVPRAPCTLLEARSATRRPPTRCAHPAEIGTLRRGTVVALARGVAAAHSGSNNARIARSLRWRNVRVAAEASTSAHASARKKLGDVAHGGVATWAGVVSELTPPVAQTLALLDASDMGLSIELRTLPVRLLWSIAVEAFSNSTSELLSHTSPCGSAKSMPPSKSKAGGGRTKPSSASSMISQSPSPMSPTMAVKSCDAAA
mmetsp:Transcript_56824/g.158246  ORF Transcript_56824/g.158246 Transcript_56824/m.158246 type:complete len:263 (-) Transcript_56824:221-1009(-)